MPPSGKKGFAILVGNPPDAVAIALRVAVEAAVAQALVLIALNAEGMARMHQMPEQPERCCA